MIYDLAADEITKLREALTVAGFMAHEWPMMLDPEFGGACPCCHVRGNSFTIDVHCWRTRHEGCGCEYSGVHVAGDIDRATAKKLAEHMRDHNGWTGYTKWKLVFGAQRPGSAAQRRR